MSEPIRIIDPSRMARIVTVLVWAWFGFDVLFGLASLDTAVALGGLGGPVAPMQRLELSDTLTGATGLALVVVHVCAGIATLRWIYIVNRNAHGLGGEMTTSPGATVFWFFVPILCFWKPFVGVRESWQATVNPSSPGSVRVPSVMRVWWGAWLVSDILSILSGQLGRSETVATVITSNWLNVVTLPLDLMLTMTFLAVVRRLSRLQRGALARRADDGSDAAPQASQIPSALPA